MGVAGQEMGVALLVAGVGEEVVGAPAVVAKVPVELGAQDFLGNVVAPAGTNEVKRSRRGHEGPEPQETGGSGNQWKVSPSRRWISRAPERKEAGPFAPSLESGIRTGSSFRLRPCG